MTLATTLTPLDTDDLRVTRALSGEILYGDDFTAQEIQRWFEHEREGYFDLYYGAGQGPTQAPAPAPAADPSSYGYSELVRQHCFSRLPRHDHARVLGLGSADGAELGPVLDRAECITVLEPSEGFRASEIAGKPVRYVAPDPSGRMPFADASFDLVVAFNVLHHIPNVSTVVREMQRVLAPGGHALLMDSTHSMGDWRRPRRGLTRHERGIPLPIFRGLIDRAGLKVLRETRCNLAVMSRLSPWLGRPVWSVPWAVRLDAWLCRLPVWSRRYHATRPWHKLRPVVAAYVLEKPAR
jgi:SAM-dependent methyltransferase